MKHQPVGKLPLLLRSLTGILLLAQSTAMAAVTTMAVGQGYTDVIPRQIVRASDDRVYVFAVQDQFNSTLKAYWTANAGLPTSASNFSGSASVTDSSILVSADAVYDGGSIIHVLVNGGGNVKDYPFDITTKTFKSAITIATDANNSTQYIGSCGVSGMVDLNAALQVAYWNSSNHIFHKSYTYNGGTNQLTLTSGPTQVDTAGSSNHPFVAVSPSDNSLTVAWVSEVAPKNILARVRSSAGTWGAIQIINTGNVWTSTSNGINIDQGPQMVIALDGTKHLTYMEDWDSSGTYGKIHYCVYNGASWTDQALTSYTHDPCIAINSAGALYIFGHGDPLGRNGESPNSMYYRQKNGSTWNSPVRMAAGSSSGPDFDGSPSVKWSAVGFNRPGDIELLFFAFNSPMTVYYGRIDGPVSSSPPASPKNLRVR